MLVKNIRFRRWLALSVPLCFATYVGAQSTPAQNPTNNNDNGRGDVASFDQFLDSHHEIAEQLRKQPSLADNKQFLKDHPALQTYLQQNPSVRQRLEQNPEAVMGQEAYWEHSGDDRTQDRNGNGAYNRNNNDNGRGDVASFDRFLDSHREIAEQLRKQPSLGDNQQFLKDHPALQAYLKQNPSVRQRLQQNPEALMGQEAYWEHSGDDRTQDRDNRYRNGNYPNGNPNSNPNTNGNGNNNASNPTSTTGNRSGSANTSTNNNDNGRGDVASFDQFLDSHHEIAEQLRKQPSLGDNQQFLKDHPALQAYLQQNPSVRQRLQQNPDALMGQEAYWEHSGDDRTQDRNRDNNYAYSRNNNNYDRDRGNGVAQHDRDWDRDRDAHQHFGEFLGSHQDIASQLSKNPSLCKDHDYLQNHPELQAYLNTHPEVQQPLTSDPDKFMKSTQQFNTNSQTKMPAPSATQPGTTTQPKPYKQ